MFFEENSLIMTAFIAGFICALFLAAFVIIWITYCMFYKERHKPENYQYDISDLHQENIRLAQKLEKEQEKVEAKKITAGIIILPSRHKQKDVYVQRPDYPEISTRDYETGTNELIDIFNERTAAADIHNLNNEINFQCDSGSQYHSEV